MDDAKLIVKVKKWVSWPYFERQHKTGQRVNLYLAYIRLFLKLGEI